MRHFREIAAAIGMPAEAAKVIRRHSWRHFGANITRVAEFSEAKKSQVGRWGSIEIMPVRYAQEVENVAMMGIILDIEKVLAAALRRVPLKKWPWLAGWEHLSPHVSLRPDMVADIPVECMPEPEDRSDDEDSEVEEGSDADEAGPERLAAEPTVAQWRGSEVLRAWDGLQRAKVAARTTPRDPCLFRLPAPSARRRSSGAIHVEKSGRSMPYSKQHHSPLAIASATAERIS